MGREEAERGHCEEFSEKHSLCEEGGWEARTAHANTGRGGAKSGVSGIREKKGSPKDLNASLLATESLQTFLANCNTAFGDGRILGTDPRQEAGGL